jgi:hypothetical protein
MATFFGEVLPLESRFSDIDDDFITPTQAEYVDIVITSYCCCYCSYQILCDAGESLRVGGSGFKTLIVACGMHADRMFDSFLHEDIYKLCNRIV